VPQNAAIDVFKPLQKSEEIAKILAKK